MPTYEIKLEVVSTHTVVVHHNEENEEDLWVDNDAKLLELAKKKIAGEEFKTGKIKDFDISILSAEVKEYNNIVKFPKL